MPRYRRARAPGASYFFTVTLHDRKSNLLVREVDLLRRCVRAARAFSVVARLSGAKRSTY